MAMSEELEHVVGPIVRGQIRSFMNDHPEAGLTEKQAKGIVKRVIRDLICETTVSRIRLAVGVRTAADASPVGVAAGEGGAVCGTVTAHGGGAGASVSASPVYHGILLDDLARGESYHPGDDA